MPRLEQTVIGWDIGGAHLKAALVENGRLLDVAQWACPLWQGLEHLQNSIAAARERWPQSTGARHAVTMSGEMVDLFANREAGVRVLAQVVAASLDGPLAFYAGERAWHEAGDVATNWQAIASANWLATAQCVAASFDDGVLVDVGSTTSDLIALRGGRVAVAGRNDAERLSSGELVYHGVVRTPLCALGPRVAFGGQAVNVMNEFFATSADVYRLTGELDPAHDLQPAADGGAKDVAATQQRLARMIGRDAHDATSADWRALASAWRAAQLAELRFNLQRVIAEADLPAGAPLVSAGCGDFLVAALARELGRPCRRFAELVLDAASTDAGLMGRAQVGAPSAAVALLGSAAAPSLARYG